MAHNVCPFTSLNLLCDILWHSRVLCDDLHVRPGLDAKSKLLRLHAHAHLEEKVVLIVAFDFLNEAMLFKCRYKITMDSESRQGSPFWSEDKVQLRLREEQSRVKEEMQYISTFFLIICRYARTTSMRVRVKLLEPLDMECGQRRNPVAC